jgi:hypothetical protein
MNKVRKFKENCPTCRTECLAQWYGLELVENTGDETLASKGYEPSSLTKAAPNLLAACKAALFELRHPSQLDCARLVSEAIRKAEGRDE